MKFSRFVFVFVGVLAGGAFSKTKHIPSYLKKCSLSDPNIMKCLLENMEIVRPHLKDGIPEMKIPSVEPLEVTQIVMNLQSLNTSFTNVKIYESSKYEVKNFDMDPKERTITISMKFPYLNMTSIYELKGKFLLFELNSQGDGLLELSDVIGTVDMKFAVKQKRGKSYWNIVDRKLSVKLGGVKLNFSRLFADNEELTRSTNEAINANVATLIPEFTPISEEIISNFIFDIVKNVFETYSINELFNE